MEMWGFNHQNMRIEVGWYNWSMMVHDFFGYYNREQILGISQSLKGETCFITFQAPKSSELKVIPQIGWSYFFLWNTLSTGWLIMDPRMPYIRDRKRWNADIFVGFLKWGCPNNPIAGGFVMKESYENRCIGGIPILGNPHRMQP